MRRPTGWLFTLCVLLCFWEPANLALSASADIGAIVVGRAGHPLFLVLRLLVAAVGIAAGLAIWNRRARAPALAKIALALSASTAVVRYGWFPGNVPPGMRLPLALLFVGYNAAWFLYLVRWSARISRYAAPPPAHDEHRPLGLEDSSRE
jgi:hypothetical protein